MQSRALALLCAFVCGVGGRLQSPGKRDPLDGPLDGPDMLRVPLSLDARSLARSIRHLGSAQTLLQKETAAFKEQQKAERKKRKEEKAAAAAAREAGVGKDE